MSRLIVLDTETTGIDPKQGHKIIEIGCVELMDRQLTGNHYHQYLNPDREIDQGAIDVHGIKNEFLEDKPRFADVCIDFIDYIYGAELIIHNAPFDVGFINNELQLIGHEITDIASICTITDSLKMARAMYPGQRNSLDALCKRLGVINSHRELHGALLDSEILADVYLYMTGGQDALDLSAAEEAGGVLLGGNIIKKERANLMVQKATDDELSEHLMRCEQIKIDNGQCLWLEKTPNG